MSLLDDLDIEIKRYRPEAGDVLVLTVPETFTLQEHHNLREMLAATCHDLGITVMVLTRGCTLDVVRKD